jgi:hypothetical protein
MAEPVRKRDSLIEEVTGGLEELSVDRLEEVRDFVQFLKQRSHRMKCGSPEALLRHFGTWEGPPGELERLVEEIYEDRHRETD